MINVWRRLSAISTIIRTTFLASIAAFSGATHAVEDRTFYRNAMAVGDNVVRILIKKGYCANSNDCIGREIIFAQSTSDGIEVELYGINDQSLVNMIVVECLKERLSAKINFSVRVYSVTKEHELSRPIWNKPSYSEFTFKQESK